MEIPREEQKQFAEAIIALSERDLSLESVIALNKLASLLVSWTSTENSIAVNLSEYIGELRQMAEGGEDTGWKSEFKKTLDKDLAS